MGQEVNPIMFNFEKSVTPTNSQKRCEHSYVLSTEIPLSDGYQPARFCCICKYFDFSALKNDERFALLSHAIIADSNKHIYVLEFVNYDSLQMEKDGLNILKFRMIDCYAEKHQLTDEIIRLLKTKKFSSYKLNDNIAFNMDVSCCDPSQIAMFNWVDDVWYTIESKIEFDKPKQYNQELAKILEDLQ